MVDAGKMQITGAGQAGAPWALLSVAMEGLHVVYPALQLTSYLLGGSQNAYPKGLCQAKPYCLLLLGLRNHRVSLPKPVDGGSYICPPRFNGRRGDIDPNSQRRSVNVTF